jgi:hypothetical protein
MFQIGERFPRIVRSRIIEPRNQIIVFLVDSFMIQDGIKFIFEMIREFKR